MRILDFCFRLTLHFVLWFSVVQLVLIFTKGIIP